MPNSNDLKDLESQLKKTVISAESFKRTSSFDLSKNIVSIHKNISSLAGHVRKVVIRVGNLEKTVENNSRKITSLKNISALQGSQVRGTNIGAKLPGSSAQTVDKDISTITKSVSSIAEILSGRKKLADNTAAYDRKKEEQEKRALAESKLEKRFDGLRKAAETIIAPVKSILDRIIEFFTTVIIGNIVLRLIKWFGDKKNADKVRSIIRFLGDHWPKLLALYLTFGTSFGKFSRTLIKIVARGAFSLAGAIARLIGARKAARFLGGRGGKLASAVIGTAVTLGGTYAATEALKGSGEEPKASEQKTQGLAGGGYVKLRFPTFSGGGFNFKGMLGGAGLGSMFGPLGMMLGAGAGAMSGFVSGEKGVDKVPAMLSDGEFVMSRGAVQKYGVDTLEAMNASGGGTNRPRMSQGATFAAGGGLIGEGNKPERLVDPALEKRKKERVASQLQAQKALSSGSGLNIKGASTGRQLGTGYGAKYQGRDAIVIKGGAAKMDLSITIAGKQYYGMKRGNDAVYTAIDNRDRGTGGFLQPGGIFGGPRMSSRMDYAQSKGKYYSSSDQKTYANYNDAKAARQSRLTSLASQQRLNRLSNRGASVRTGGKGVRAIAEMKAQMAEDQKRGGDWGKFTRGLTRMFSDPNSKLGKERLAKLSAADKASTARVKQTGAQSIGRYYSSSDGKYYKDYNAAVQAKKLRLAQQQKKTTPKITPLPKPKPKYNPAGGGMGGGRGAAGAKGSPKTPKFSATTRGMRSKTETLGLMR